MTNILFSLLDLIVLYIGYHTTRGEYMQLDPKRALLVNELGDIVKELSNYKPVTQEQKAAYYRAMWMLDSVVTAFRKEDTSLEYEDNLDKYD